jgi:hypothetical protein
MNKAGILTADSKEHLRELGLPAGVGWEAVQSRYRQLVLAHHPDLHPGDGSSAERFRRIAAAYEALSHLRRERSTATPEGLERMMRSDPRLQALSSEELRLRLRYSSSAWVRAAVAGLVGESPESRGLLRAALMDPEPLVRACALEALGRAGRPGDLLGILVRPQALRQVGADRFLRASARIWRRVICSGLLRRAAAAGPPPA